MEINISKRIIYIIVFVFVCTSLVNANSKFNIKYLSVPDSIQVPVNFSFAVWETYLYSDIPINVTVHWSSLNSNVLAAAQPTDYYFNYSDQLKTDLYYPKALAEKLLSTELGDVNAADIDIYINKDISWYIGVDSLCPEGQFDLVTICLHEIAHGLGVVGNFTKDENSNSLTLEKNSLSVSVYDSYVFFKDSISLNESYKLLSSEKLYTLATSDSLFWNGSFATIANDNVSPKIYSPSIFNYGSSITHLDESTYPKNSANSLLTPSFDAVEAEVIRAPGSILLGILADIGWTDCFIQHTPPRNSELLTEDVTIYAAFDSVFRGSVFIFHYSYDGFNNEISIPMEYVPNTDSVKITIDGYPFERDLSYYFSIETESNLKVVVPHNAPLNYFNVHYGQDLIAPVINHTKIDLIYEDDPYVEFIANVDDDIGVASVQLLYAINNKVDSLLMSYENGSYYIKLQIDTINTISEGTVFYYKISSTDVSHQHNTSYTTTYSVIISTVGSVLNNYASDFNDLSITDFILDGFEISEQENFSDGALHTTHPYESPMIEPGYLNFTATLNYPIRIRETEAYLSFDEVVLVEPGELNALYGQHGFWDYVIVEGSKDRKNWYAFDKTGYDSSEDDVWFSTYNSSIINDNKYSSTAIGRESLYRPRIVNLLGNKYLRRDDTVFVRFRLYSDPFTNAWGWSIDNLKIQDPELLLGVSELNEDDSNYIYPTYCDNFITINYHNTGILIVDVVGDLVYESGSTNEIDLSSFKTGIYFLTIKSDKQTLTKKFYKK